MAISLKSISRNVAVTTPRIVLYGPHGIGKSTFGAMAPQSIFLPLEDGMGRLVVDHFPLMTSWSDVMDAIGTLYQEEHDYKTIVVDTIDWLEPLVWTEACRRHEKANIEDFGYGKGYLMAAEVWREFLTGLNALRTEKSMIVVLLAHSEIRRFEDPAADPYDRYQIKLHQRATALIEEWADCVLFANFKTYVTQTKVGFNQTVRRGIGTGERTIYTEERPAFRAKNRYSLPPELPLSWEAFAKAINPI